MRVLAVLASAVVWTSAFPPRACWPLAWVGIAPFLVALRTVPTLGRAMALAWLWSVVSAWCVGTWLPRGVVDYFQQPVSIGALFFLGTATLTAGVQYMAFAVAYRVLANRYSTVLLPPLAAAAFVTAELARVRAPGADAWGIVGYSQSGAVAQIAEITGVYGVSFVVLAVNAALAELWLVRRRGGALRAPALGFVVAAAAGLVVTAAGALRFQRPAGAPVAPGRTRIAVVQGDVDMSAQWSPSHYGKNLDAYLRLTRDVLTSGGVALVLWPESAMTFFLAEEPAYRRVIALATAPRTQLLAGAPRAADATHAAFFNSAFLLAPDGEIIGRYDKQRLMPFAEYFPLSIDVLRRQFGRVRQFTPGASAGPLDSAAGAAGVLICNEGFYGDLAADRVRAGATWLASLANDTWLSDAQFARMALDMVRFRAIEQRRWVVRASTWGPSALIDPFGRLIAATAPGAPATVVGEIEALGGSTMYARLGDAFAWACASLVVCALLFALVRRTA